MNNLEKEACSKLQIENVPEQQQALADECGIDLAQCCAIRKRRKLETTSNYLNSDFIFRSCAEIERVWSHLEEVVSQDVTLISWVPCSSLKYWDLDLLATALLEVKKSNRERIMEDAEQQYIALNGAENLEEEGFE